MADQPTALPTAKVTAATAAAAITTLAVFILAKAGVELTATEAGAITTLLTFAAGYLTPSRGTARHLEEN